VTVSSRIYFIHALNYVYIYICMCVCVCVCVCVKVIILMHNTVISGIMMLIIFMFLQSLSKIAK